VPNRLTACIWFWLLAGARAALAIGQPLYIAESPVSGGFAIVQGRAAAAIWVDFNDYPGVLRAARDLQTDILRVTGSEPVLATNQETSAADTIFIGTIGRSRIIDRLAASNKIDVSQTVGKWESFLIQVVPNPVPGVRSGLVIAGSDKRGTIFGIYDVSEQIGVSPWHWWDSVAVKTKKNIFVQPGRYAQGPPSVKYRGIFLNDEAPDLSNWVREKYGGIAGIPGNPANYGHEFYTNIFELLLRLKGNFLWPAMWNNAFNEDDPQNAALADEYGIVMGTSHQEPMIRAQKEWDRRYQKTIGSWNYAKNPDVLEDFWREGVRRNKNYESIITLGLRGANDTPMASGGPEANRALLEKIIGVERGIISQEINPDLARVPQAWCLYKEVQDFYNAGMRVPDDVTLLWAEDNWGNIRRLPTAKERLRAGGAGVYYHFDYHGGPRSYQWINTSPIPKIWDQMSLAKEYGADRIWVVNVGHFKGYEFPMEYFMSLAWNTSRWTNDNTSEFTQLWTAREFGQEFAPEIADIISKCSKYNGRRKPELLEPDTYSLVNYQEAERVVADFDLIAAKAEQIQNRLPAADRNAFYDLAAFPARAAAQLNAMYRAAGKNALYARQGRASANSMADQTVALFQAHTNLMAYYNHTFAGGKWDHFMDQSHVGYRGWRDPPENTLDAIKLTRIDVPQAAAMGVAVEGSESAWPVDSGVPILPQFDSFNRQRHYIDVFNKGTAPFQFSASADKSWIQIDRSSGTIQQDDRLWISVDWERASKGHAAGSVMISGAGAQVLVNVNASNPAELDRASLRGFVEGEGVVSIEPEHYTRKIDSGESRWIRVADYGRTLSGMRAESPPDASPNGNAAACLEYQMYLFNVGAVGVETIAGPTLNFAPDHPLRFALSFDDAPPQTIILVPQDYSAQNGNRDWETTVMDNARCSTSTHLLVAPGYHTLKLWMVDPGVVIQRLIVNCGGQRPSYLGPPESYCNLQKSQ
jgi:hypothetical protein